MKTVAGASALIIWMKLTLKYRYAALPNHSTTAYAPPGPAGHVVS